MTGTYDLSETEQYSLDALLELLREKGVTKVLWKPLQPNDNSKNQPYFGGDFSALNSIPTGPLTLHKGTSNKPSTRAGKSVIKAPLNFFWLSPTGYEFKAPNAQLILYPQYPEVRLSGFLQGSKVTMSGWMNSEKEGRTPGRHLILGIHPEGKILAYLAVPGSVIAKALETHTQETETTVFNRINFSGKSSDTKQLLLNELRQIHQAGWHKSVRLKKDALGNIAPANYLAPNGGGYTLEALLGVFPNGDSAPDFMGWEIKQYGVSSCEKTANISKAVTLMTPEPDGGFYKKEGVNEFVKKFGYPDKLGRENRYNFGGTHYANKENPSTKLVLQLSGFRSNSKFDADGSLQLCSQDGEVAASWSFTKMLEHWKKKHAQAAYVPALASKETPKEYFYCSPVYLAEGTDFSFYLNGINSGNVYYDPGIKLEKNAAGKEVSKRRSQFRVRFKEVKSLYKKWSAENL